MKNKLVVKYLLFLLISIYLSGYVNAQQIEEGLQEIKAHTLSLGSANIYDNYLSPLEYKGYRLSYNYQTNRDTHWFHGHFKKQQNIGIEFAKANNPYGNASFYELLLKYQLGGHYHVGNLHKLELNAGGLAGIFLGGLYSTRNGNNPATGRIYAMLNPSILLLYPLKKEIKLRFQLDFNLIGLYFQPEFGESYYELYLGNRKGIIHLSSLHNQRYLKTYLSSDIHLKNSTFRIGILCEFLQTKINHTITHNYTYNLVLGIPFYSYKK